MHKIFTQMYNKGAERMSLEEIDLFNPKDTIILTVSDLVEAKRQIETPPKEFYLLDKSISKIRYHLDCSFKAGETSYKGFDKEEWMSMLEDELKELNGIFENFKTSMSDWIATDEED